MSYEITYRKATLEKEDISLAIDMMKKLCVYQKMDDTSMINEENMRKLLSDGAGSGLITYVDGKPAAFMYYYYNYPMLIGTKCIYIDCLYRELQYLHSSFLCFQQHATSIFETFSRSFHQSRNEALGYSLKPRLSITNVQSTKRLKNKSRTFITKSTSKRNILCIEISYA